MITIEYIEDEEYYLITHPDYPSVQLPCICPGEGLLQMMEFISKMDVISEYLEDE